MPLLLDPVDIPKMENKKTNPRMFYPQNKMTEIIFSLENLPVP